MTNGREAFDLELLAGMLHRQAEREKGFFQR